MPRPMSVLTREAIERELADGRLVIEPLSSDQIGPASVDLTLGDEIRLLVAGPQPIPVTEDSDYREFSEPRSLATPYLLEPGRTLLGITRERVTLPGDLCGFLEGRSRFARLGLMIHVTSALVQPGVSNCQVLEMSNVSGRPLEIQAGVRVCQLVLLRAEGRATYSGRFARQVRI